MDEQEVLTSVFIHYGSGNFNNERFNHINKKDINVKPRSGGLWGSIYGKDGGWEAWCEAENYDKYNHKERAFFKFKLNPNTNLLYIDDVYVVSFYKAKKRLLSKLDYIDWFRVSQDYDAVYFDLSKNPFLYNDFYGVDCDSICVFNPDCIEEVND